MTNEPTKLSDEEVIALAQAERDAGVPDMQTAAAAQERLAESGSEAEAHPS